MTNPTNNTSPNLEPESQNPLRSFLNSLKPSRKKVAIGLTAIATGGILGYGGVNYLVKKKLPPLLETQIGNIIKRPIELGEVKGFSLGGIELGKTIIPATAQDPDQVSVEEVKVEFNIFPLIFKRTLPADITLIQPDVYLEQSANGEWLNLDFLATDPDQEKTELPVKLNLGVDLQDTNITLVPYKQAPIKVGIDGTARYNQNEGELVTYDLDATIAQAQATIQGETLLETGQTDSKLLVKDLALADLATLLPNSPVILNSGVLNTNLDIDIPSFEEITSASIKGFLSINDVAGEVTALSTPIRAKSEVDFAGKDAQFKQTQASFGDIVAQVAGTVNLERGYDLDINVLPFRLSSLPTEITKQLPVAIGGEVAAALQLRGKIQKPLLTGKVNNTRIINVDKTQFEKIEANVKADLAEVVLENLQIIPVAGGKITATGIILTKIEEALASKQAIDLSKMALEFNFSSELPTQDLVTPYYQLPTEVTVENLSATGKVTGSLDNLNALVNWQIPQSQKTNVEDISGSGELLLENNQLLLENTQVRIGDGVTDVAAKANLGNKQWQADLAVNSLSLTPFLSQFTIPNLNLDRPMALEQADIKLSGKLDELDPNKVTGLANVYLDIDNGSSVAVASKLNSGIVSGNVITNEINFNRFVPILPVTAAVRSSRINFSGELQQLLELQKKSDLSSWQADIDADLNVADGVVNAIADLSNNQFTAKVNANNISSNSLLTAFAPANFASLALDNINAQIDIETKINPLINNETNLPVTINRAIIESGVQKLDATGNFIVSNPLTNPDLSVPNLDVNAQIDFDRLPIRQIVILASDNNQLIANSTNLQGQVEFEGVLRGKNLISAPIEPGNISLTGDVALLDFTFNNVDFDPVMTGKVNLSSGSEIALDLQGKQDIIAVSAIPCTRSNCRLPYVPTNLEFRLGEDTTEPIIVTGKKNQDIFSLDINNFPLTLLSFAPGKAIGIRGGLTGNTTGNIALNLYTLATKGQVKVEQPGVGYIQADQLIADFNYDPNSNIAELTTASLELGNSKYDLNAALDLQTAAIEGELNIPEAYIQDILTSLRWFTVADLINLFNTADYVEPTAIKPQDEIYTLNKEVTIKLNILRQVENAIQQLAAAREQGGLPTELDIQGQYKGLITFGGTLEKPEADFNIEANNWQWEPQPRFYNFVEPIGLVKEELPIINIPQILVAGNLEGTAIDLATAKLQLENTTFSAIGTLSPEKEDLSFQVSDLTLENINRFIKLPVDMAGEIDVTGKLTGSLAQPQIAGEVAFVDGVFNGNPLPEKFIGSFDYNGARLQFDTTAPSFISLDATIPYPIVPGESDRLSAEIKLDPEAFALLGIVSQGYLNWVGGSGDADLKVDARLDLNRTIPIYDLNATGIINLDNSQLDLVTPFFTAPFQGTGKITVDNQILTVESLTGTFAEKDLSVSGSLPLLTLVNNLENPLTLDLPPGEMHIQQLYKGGVAGNIQVTGAALQPVIGGELNLENGRIFIPKIETPTPNDVQTELAENITRRETAVATVATNEQNNPPAFIPTLNEVQVGLTDLSIRQRPLFRIDLSGDLTLNGTVDQPNNIKPDGTITLGQAWINFLSSEFLVNRSRENTVTFTPDAGIFNPYLDIQFKTVVNEFDQADLRLPVAGSNEIRDPISQDNLRNSITINLIIEGETATIMPDLAQNKDDCVIRPNSTPLTEAKPFYSQEELDKLTRCFNFAALAKEDETLNLSAVKLTSIPDRSEGEITTLLGSEFLSFADRVSNSSQSELFNLGVNTFVIEPAYRRLLYVVDNEVVKFGRKIGLDYLHIFPELEGIYEINKDSSLRATYNYGIQNSQEVRLEYQLRF